MLLLLVRSLVPQMMLQQPVLVQSVPAQTLSSMAAPGGSPPVIIAMAQEGINSKAI